MRGFWQKSLFSKFCYLYAHTNEELLKVVSACSYQCLYVITKWCQDNVSVYTEYVIFCVNVKVFKQKNKIPCIKLVFSAFLIMVLM